MLSDIKKKKKYENDKGGKTVIWDIHKHKTALFINLL